MHGTYELAYIAHFVIIPAYSLHQLLIAYGHYLGLRSIKQGTEVYADDIAAHYFVFVIPEAFVSRCFHCCIHFFSRGLFVQYAGQLGK